MEIQVSVFWVVTPEGEGIVVLRNVGVLPHR